MQESVTQDREKYIGGSDISSIMEYPEAFTKRFDLLMYKALLKENTFKGNAYTEYGNVMEGKIRDYINKEYGYDFVEGQIILEDSTVMPLRYHDDGTSEVNKTQLEIKTTSQIHETVDEYEHYLVQLLTGMMAREYPNGILAVYSRPDDMSEEFDPKRLQVFFVGIEDYEILCNKIQKAIQTFREDYEYVIEQKFFGGEINENDLPSRQPLVAVCADTMTIGGTEFPVTWLLQNGSKVKDACDELKRQLKESMEKHGIRRVKFDDLGVSLSYVDATPDTLVEKFDAESFKEDHPKLWKEYQVATPKKGRAAYVTARVAKGKKA